MTDNDDEDVLSKDIYNGKLFKRGKINKSWKERHFIVYRSEQRMEYYATKQDAMQKKQASGNIDLSTAEKIEVLSNYDIILIKSLPDNIHHNDKAKSDKEYTFQLYCDSRTYTFSALNKDEFFEWLNYLKSCLYGAIIKQGWLRKLGAVNKNWKRRYFVLNKYQQMKYFEDTQKTKLLGLIDCTKILSVTNGRIYANDLRYTLELVTKQRKWIIAANDKEGRLEWARLINAIKGKDWKQQLNKIMMEEEKKENAATVGLKQDNFNQNKQKKHDRNISTARIELLQKAVGDGMGDNDDYKSPKSPKSPNAPNTPSSNNDYNYNNIQTPISPKLPKDIMEMFESEIPSKINHNDIESNVCLRRIIYILKMYKEWISQIESGAVHIKTLYEQIHELPNYGIIVFLNDFNHLMIHYNDKLEAIYNIIVHVIGTSNISSIHCKRNYRDCMDTNMRDKLYFDEQNSLEITCQQIIDRAYCYFLHSFDIYKFTESEAKELESKLNDNDDDDDEKKEDKTYCNDRLKCIHEMTKEKRENLQRLLGEDRFNDNKFIHKIKRKYYDDDEEKKTNFFDDINIIENMSDFGITWYYWNYYKLQRDMNDPWSHGKKFGDLYIDKNYCTLKLELINNKICPLTIQQYNDLTERVKIYSKSDQVKKLKANRSKVHEFEIKAGTSLSFNHITAILLYCNFDRFRNKLLETYGLIESDESFEDIKKRHSQFSIIGRLLREIVACFSEQIPFKQITIYVSVNIQFMFIDTSLQIKNPLSATTQYNVIWNYSAQNQLGLMLELKCGALTRRDHLPFFDCKLFSDFSIESEILFIAGDGTLKMINIIQYKSDNILFDYQQYLRCIRMFKQFILGKSIKTSVTFENDQKILSKLIKNELSKKDESFDKYDDIPLYIDGLFHVYCKSQREYYIDLNTMNISGYSLLRQLFIDDENSSCKLDIYSNLLSNLTEIEIKNDAGSGVFKSTVILSQIFIENILQILTKNNDNIKLNKMVICYPDETEMKLQDVLTTYNSKLNEINWTLSTSKQEKRDTSGDVGQSYCIEILTISRM